MSGESALRVHNLHKVFKVYASPKMMLKELILGRNCHTEFHALCGISFDVRPGEVVGVMGRNGAGKSTLLRILAGTLNATSGSVEVYGKVSAILELGSGFNPEYSGRENIFSGGLVLGMSKQEIAERIQGIIAFSELEDSIDRPFKTYSSGMQARLTFATAISVNPDILIVDEALSVGDAIFQRKCYARMQEFRQQGKTIFFVTHSDNAVTEFCDRAILLEKGKILADGSAYDVSLEYFKQRYAMTNKQVAVTEASNIRDSREENFSIADIKRFCKRVGDGQRAQITSARFVDIHGRTPDILRYNQTYVVEFSGVCNESVNDFGFGIAFTTMTGLLVYAVNSRNLPQSRRAMGKGEGFTCKFSFASRLINSDYFVSIDIGDYDPINGKPLDCIADVFHIKAEENSILHRSSLVSMDASLTLEGA